ncbi:MAG: heavy metal translocating P-type ATPase [Emergencia sp.]
MKQLFRPDLAPQLHQHDDHCGCGCDHDHHAEHHHEEHHHDEHHDHDCHDDHCGCGCGHEDHEEHDEHRHDHHEQISGDAGRTVYILENLGCAHCAARMEDAIGQLPGVRSASITFATKQLRISADHPDDLLPQIQKICASIESAVTVRPRETAAAETAAAPAAESSERKEKQESLLLIAGAILFAAGFALHHEGTYMTASIVILVIAYIILGGRVLLDAVRGMAHGQIFDENFLMGIATLGAFAIAEYPEAVGVMLFYRIGEYFEDRAVERSRGQIMAAVDMRPETVTLVKGGETCVIPAEDALIGDILLIRPGDRIPLDGVIVEGESRLDTSPITGEPVPVAVSAGDPITSGCVNTSGQLTMEVSRPLSESMVTRILDSVENAAASKPKIDRFITRFSRIYTPCVVLAALLIAVIPSLVGGNWNYWIYTALTFLVMSCPCALVLSVPLAFFSGIGAGSKKGILFKGGISIEALGRLGAVVMDKTGTITEGNFTLQQIIPAEGYSEDALLSLCAGCEQRSTHPIAVSITSAAEQRGLSLTAPETLEEIPGYGIAAEGGGNKILCGNRKLMEKYHISMDSIEAPGYGSEVFVAVNGCFAGSLIVSDTVKADARSAVSRLKSMGLHTVMLTGDAQAAAEAVAAETGIDEVHGKLLPQDKLSLLSGIRERFGRVMFIGDGINDAPVLAGADVGAAMGSGADAAIEAADAVFMTSSVDSIPQAIEIARSTGRIAMQNVVFALAVKAVVMILGIAGFASMWLAVFADSGVAMLCVLNSIRILYKK